MNFCGKCGTKVDDTMSFCPFCGSALETSYSENKVSGKPVTAVENDLVEESAISADFVEPIPNTECGAPALEVQTDFEDITTNEPSQSHAVNKTDNSIDTGLTYITLPKDKSSAGASAMGIVAFILGLISLSSVISSFMLTIDVYRQLSISVRYFAVTASSAVPGVIAIILSQKAIDKGYKCGISKAAEITGAIGAFCHVGTLFILLLGLFI